MTVRAVIGFHHLPFGVNGWAALSDHDITTPSGVTCPDGTGGIYSNGTATNTYENILIPLSKYLVAPVAKIWVGVRVTVLIATPRTTQYPISVYPVSNTGLGNARPLGTLSQLLGVADGSTIPAGKVFYAEFAFTVGSAIVERRVNGVTLSSVTIAEAVTRNAILALEGSGPGSPVNRTRWADIYVNDDQGSPGFLDPQIVTRLQLNASGTGWVTVPAGSTLTQAVAPPTDTSGDALTKLVAVSPSDKTPMTLAMVSNLPPNSVANAIEITAGASSTVTGQTKSGMSLKRGSDVLTGANVTGPTTGTYQYNNPVGVFTAPPGGGAWTPEAINATSLILTPDV